MRHGLAEPVSQKEIETAENGFVVITELLFLLENLAQSRAIQRQGHPLSSGKG